MRLYWKWVLPYAALVVLVMAVAHHWGMSWISWGIGFGLAGLLAYGHVRVVSKPLMSMVQFAREMAAGAFGPVPVGAPDPELRALSAALGDMQHQIQARIDQMALEKSRLEAVLTSITEGILVTEENGRVLMANRAFGKLFGVSSDPAGKMPIELVRYRDVQEAIEHSLSSGQVVFLNLTVSDVLERHFDVHVAPIFQGDTCIGTVTVFYDITELRRLERIRKDFVANVSHELRTPLTTIKGCAATLADGALDDPVAARRFVHMINTHADRLHNLVEDVLDLSRMESGKLTLEVDVCRVRRIVDSAMAQIRGRAAEKHIALEAEVSEDVQVRCDARLIEQALLNLLDNAVKYTPEGGMVRVQVRDFSRDENGRRRNRVSPESGESRREAQQMTTARAVRGDYQRIALEVKDSGIGIPLASMSRVFERFYRVDQGRSRAMGGTGLGLSIVRHIMEAHGERVYVESELGKGSLFGLTLPRG